MVSSLAVFILETIEEIESTITAKMTKQESGEDAALAVAFSLNRLDTQKCVQDANVQLVKSFLLAHVPIRSNVTVASSLGEIPELGFVIVISLISVVNAKSPFTTTVLIAGIGGGVGADGANVIVT